MLDTVANLEQKDSVVNPLGGEQCLENFNCFNNSKHSITNTQTPLDPPVRYEN